MVELHCAFTLIHNVIDICEIGIYRHQLLTWTFELPILDALRKLNWADGNASYVVRTTIQNCKQKIIAYPSVQIWERPHLWFLNSFGVIFKLVAVKMFDTCAPTDKVKQTDEWIKPIAINHALIITSNAYIQYIHVLVCETTRHPFCRTNVVWHGKWSY